MSGVGGIDMRNGERGLSKLEEDGERLRDVKVYGGIGRTAGRCLGRAIHHMPTKVGELGLALPLQAAEQLRWCGTRPGVDGCPLSSLQPTGGRRLDLRHDGVPCLIRSSMSMAGLMHKGQWSSEARMALTSVHISGGWRSALHPYSVSSAWRGTARTPHQQTDVTG